MRPILILAALILSLPVAGHAQALDDRKGWQVVPTPHSFADLVQRVETAVKAEGMLLVTQASASAGAKGRGIDIPGNRVMGVFRNDYALRMLEASVAAGIEAPIRFYVTENTDGTATLSWKTPGAVFSPYFEEGGQPLEDLAFELDLVFLSIAERAVASE
ncbi:DUF302 domain-containing protein [Roseibium denhamense]|uniref:DUF302 domain-containing protein n=1 Tax=Roseibium denhamense TaxID=76305 RepID=A0ABY1PJ86_9HYPH|nr:DUF302 domain-containing protein [Roseibium denhamense]MTI05876.1 DUF302 domain-containing protein [Roseibium denhamense]SMP35549.1 protein of unknown function DUF302 [Roseibium denhamense]